MAETGTAGAIAELARSVNDQAEPPAEQLDLLAASQRPAAERLSWDGEKLAAEVARTGKAGRPKGAQNLATRELKQWIVHLLGGTPQEAMARWAMLQPEELAKRLGCTVAEAFDRQQKIRMELAPYFMARMQPVDDQGRPVPFVALAIGNQVGNANGAAPWAGWFNGQTPEMVDVTPEEGE